MDIDDVQSRETNPAGESRASADVQTDRVDALRNRIRAGDLVPDLDRIAKALLGQGVVELSRLELLK